MRCSTYSGAVIFVGRLNVSESCHKYSYLVELSWWIDLHVVMRTHLSLSFRGMIEANRTR